MYARHPEIAQRWRKESGPQRGLPERARKKKRTARNDRREHLVRQFLKQRRHG